MRVDRFYCDARAPVAAIRDTGRPSAQTKCHTQRESQHAWPRRASRLTCRVVADAVRTRRGRQQQRAPV